MDDRGGISSRKQRRSLGVRLVKMKLQNFRRFESATIDLNEDLVALVGPNEAGKSSVLRALELLGDQKSPETSDVHRGSSGHAEVWGLYVFDDKDRAVAKSIERCENVALVWVQHTSQGKSVWHFEPTPRRDLLPRSTAEARLVLVMEDPAVLGRTSTDTERQWDDELVARVTKILQLTLESLNQPQIEELRDLANRIRAVEELNAEDGDEETRSPAAAKARAARELAASTLEALAANESEETPSQRLLGELSNSLPLVATFDENERELSSTYEINAASEQRVPPALTNLCELAELDLPQVQADVDAGRFAHLEGVFERANARLKYRFRDAWKQSDVYPRLSVPNEAGVLRISVAVDGGGDYTETEERSDGLRWFIALHAFLAARGASNPILLVDEAETHLHYDAQADLIEMLMRQRLAQKVVYTTHSIGCLPPDLGRGVRAVIPESEDTSTIANSFWAVQPSDQAKVGYAPLLFAMGATLLPLTVPRYAVLVEGPADAVLLPSLLREATASGPLAYRIVPGLSELDPVQVNALRQSASRIVCLTDGDQGGADLRAKWTKVGVPTGSILDLGSIVAGGTLEDLVEPSIFAEAANTEIETWNLGMARVTVADLPATDR
jgi:energy-coupling factor transporter ATP-binding protein EcfA2